MDQDVTNGLGSEGRHGRLVGSHMFKSHDFIVDGGGKSYQHTV